MNADSGDPIACLESLLEQGCRAATEYSGAQLSVWAKGTLVVDRSFGCDGMGYGVHTDSLFSIYCAAKPLLSLALLKLDECGDLPFETRIGDVIPEVTSRLSTLSICELLSQSACLVRPLGFEGIMSRAVLKDRVIELIDPGPGYNRTGISGYSEFAAWHILGEMVRRTAGISPGVLIETEVIGPLGLSGELVSDLESMATSDIGRIRTNLALGETHNTAAAMESTGIFRKYAGDGLGAYATMRGLALFYQHLLTLLGGNESPLAVSEAGLRRMVTTQVEAFDILLQRRCTYGLGFLTGLAEHHMVSDVSPEAFGHVGLMGMTVAFADPKLQLAAAWHTNGMVRNDNSMGARRATMSRHLLEGVLSG